MTTTSTSYRTLLYKTDTGKVFRYADGHLEWEPLADAGIPTTRDWMDFLARRTVVLEDKFTNNKGRTNAKRQVQWTGKHPMVCGVCLASVSWFDAEPIIVGSATRFKKFLRMSETREGESISIMEWVQVGMQKKVCGCKQCQRHVMATFGVGGSGVMDLTVLVVAEAEMVWKAKQPVQQQRETV